MPNVGTVGSVVRTAINRVFKAKVIDWFTGSTLFSKNKHNEIVACLNPLLNMSGKIVFNNNGVFQSADADIQYSDANVILQFDVSQILLASTSGTSGMNYRGEWSSSNSYSAGDVVRKRSGDSQGVWVCTVAQPIGGAAPQWPEPSASGGTDNWQLLSAPIGTFNGCAGGADQTFYFGGWQA